MTHLLLLPLYALIALLTAGILVVFFGIGNRADVPLGWQLNAEDIERAKALLERGAKAQPERMATLTLDPQDLNLVANYLLNRYNTSAARVGLKKNQLTFNATLTLPDNPLGKYLNITLAFANVAGKQLPVISQFKAGKLPLPPAVATFAVDYFIRRSSLSHYFTLATRPVKNIQIDPEHITVTHFSSMESLVQAKHLLTQPNDRDALSVYQNQINRMLQQHDPKRLLSLAQLLQSTFSLAQQRSTPDTAITENRLALLAVNAYVNRFANPLKPHKDANKLYYPTFLFKRNDLAQHFMASAALAASLNSQVASIVGEKKELSDSQQGGSGFSFADLAADKAGARLGETAVASSQSALKLQQILAHTQDYRDFMPDPKGLPEPMGKTEFKKSYQSIHSPTYHALIRQIDQQIARLPVYQNP